MLQSILSSSTEAGLGVDLLRNQDSFRHIISLLEMNIETREFLFSSASKNMKFWSVYTRTATNLESKTKKEYQRIQQELAPN